MQGALKVLNDALLRGRTTSNVTSAIGIILHEWFRVRQIVSLNCFLLWVCLQNAFLISIIVQIQVSGTKTANPHDVEDYLDNFENYSDRKSVV